MWNPLSPSEVIAAMGSPVRDAARGEEPLDDWQSGQLLSVYSATRHLAAEVGAVEPHLGELTGELAAALRSAAEPPELVASLSQLAEQLRDVGDSRQAAEIACRALDLVRAEGSATAETVREQIHVALAHAVELEVRLLADAIEGPVEP